MDKGDIFLELLCSAIRREEDYIRELRAANPLNDSLRSLCHTQETMFQHFIRREAMLDPNAPKVVCELEYVMVGRKLADCVDICFVPHEDFTPEHRYPTPVASFEIKGPMTCSDRRLRSAVRDDLIKHGDLTKLPGGAINLERYNVVMLLVDNPDADINAWLTQVLRQEGNCAAILDRLPSSEWRVGPPIRMNDAPWDHPGCHFLRVGVLRLDLRL